MRPFLALKEVPFSGSARFDLGIWIKIKKDGSERIMITQAMKHFLCVFFILNLY